MFEKKISLCWPYSKPLCLKLFFKNVDFCLFRFQNTVSYIHPLKISSIFNELVIYVFVCAFYKSTRVKEALLKKHQVIFYLKVVSAPNIMDLENIYDFFCPWEMVPNSREYETFFISKIFVKNWASFNFIKNIFINYKLF